jgi:hypothetical protein
VREKSRDQCYDFGNRFGENNGDKMAALVQNSAVDAEQMIITLVSMKIKKFSQKFGPNRRNLAKIA